MKPFLGPLDGDGRVPAQQQTRVAAFLMSAHGALARQLGAALPLRLREGWHVELLSQYCHEMEFLSLLAGATSWVIDPPLAFMVWQWELAWLPRPLAEATDRREGLLIDLAAFAHGVHAVTRPAALLPENTALMDPFALALRRIEFESGRLMQAQTIFLKGAQFAPIRDAVAAAVDRRHEQIRELWITMLHGLEIDISVRHLGDTAYHAMRPAKAEAR